MKLNETGMLDELFVLDNFILETSEGNYRCSFEQTGRTSYKASTPFADIFIDSHVDMTIRFFGKENQGLNISRLPLYIQIVAQMSIVQILFS